MTEWRTDAACLGMDPDIFCDTPQGVLPVQAMRTCLTCPVREPCLDEALARPANVDSGVWGATTDLWRRQLRAGKITPKEALRRARLIAKGRTDAEILRSGRESRRRAARQRAAERDERKAFALRQAETLIAVVAAKHRVEIEDLKGPRKDAHLVAARHEAMAVVRSRTGLPYPRIGEMFGTHHTTVMYAVRKVPA